MSRHLILYAGTASLLGLVVLTTITASLPLDLAPTSAMVLVALWLGLVLATWRAMWWTGDRTAIVHHGCHVFAVAIAVTTELAPAALAVVSAFACGTVLKAWLGDGVVRARLFGPAMAFATATTALAFVSAHAVARALQAAPAAGWVGQVAVVTGAMLAYLIVEQFLLAPIIVSLDERPASQVVRQTLASISVHLVSGVVLTFAMVTAVAAGVTAAVSVIAAVAFGVAAASLGGRELFRARRIEREVLWFTQQSAVAEDSDAVLALARSAAARALAYDVEVEPSEPAGGGDAAEVAWGSRQVWLVGRPEQSPAARVSAPGWQRHVLTSFASAAAMALAAESARSRIRHEAHHDPLTELPNRRRFLRDGTSILGRCTPDGPGAVLCYVDLNGFKQVNDTHSHEAGDEVLRAAAQTLEAAVRPGDLVGRLGGDEFAALLTGTSDADGAVKRLGQALGQLPYGVTAAVGAAEHPMDGGSIEELLRVADAAMYADKGTRRG